MYVRKQVFLLKIGVHYCRNIGFTLINIGNEIAKYIAQKIRRAIQKVEKIMRNRHTWS